MKSVTSRQERADTVQIGPFIIGRVVKPGRIKVGNPKGGRPTRSEAQLRMQARIKALKDRIRLAETQSEYEEILAELSELRDQRKGKKPRENPLQQIAAMLVPLIANYAGVSTPPPSRRVVHQGEIVTEPVPRQITAADTIPTAAPPATTPHPDIAAMSTTSAQIVGIISAMTPEQGARWFIAQESQGAKTLVRYFVDTPDDGLDDLLGKVLFLAPDYRGIVEWLRANRPWFLETVHQIRATVAASMPRT